MDRGQIVGVYYDSLVSHGFLDDAGTFTPLDFPGGLNTVAFGINKQGQIVGRYQAQGSPRDHGFLYDQGLFTTLDPPQAESTWATRINDKLQIVGFYGSPERMGMDSSMITGSPYYH